MNTFHSPHGSIGYVDVGTGPCLVLLHGFPLSRTMWRHMLADLSEDCRVIVPDLRGFGSSVGPDAPSLPIASDTPQSRAVTMEAFGEDLLLLMDHLQLDHNVVLGGLSMGGYIAQALLVDHPHRFGAAILFDTKAAADSADAAAIRLKMAERVLERGPRIQAEAMLPKLFAPQTYASRMEIVFDVEATILGTSPESIAAAQRGMAIRRDCRAALGQIATPTLLIVGEHDVISPPDEMREMANAIPGSTFAIIPNAGHLPPLENPEATSRACLDFLRGLNN